MYCVFAKTATGYRQEYSAAAVGYLGKFGRLRKLRSILRKRLCLVRRAKNAPKPTLTNILIYIYETCTVMAETLARNLPIFHPGKKTTKLQESYVAIYMEFFFFLVCNIFPSSFLPEEYFTRYLSRKNKTRKF